MALCSPPGKEITRLAETRRDLSSPGLSVSVRVTAAIDVRRGAPILVCRVVSGITPDSTDYSQKSFAVGIFSVTGLLI
jgi:hypothetical protein